MIFAKSKNEFEWINVQKEGNKVIGTPVGPEYKAEHRIIVIENETDDEYVSSFLDGMEAATDFSKRILKDHMDRYSRLKKADIDKNMQAKLDGILMVITFHKKYLNMCDELHNGLMKELTKENKN